MKTISQFRKFKIGKKSYDFEYAGHRKTKKQARELAKKRRESGEVSGYARVIKKRVPELKWDAKNKKMKDIGRKKAYFVYEIGGNIESLVKKRLGANIKKGREVQGKFLKARVGTKEKKKYSDQLDKLTKENVRLRHNLGIGAYYEFSKIYEVSKVITKKPSKIKRSSKK